MRRAGWAHRILSIGGHDLHICRSACEYGSLLAHARKTTKPRNLHHRGPLSHLICFMCVPHKKIGISLYVCMLLHICERHDKASCMHRTSNGKPYFASLCSPASGQRYTLCERKLERNSQHTTCQRRRFPCASKKAAHTKSLYPKRSQ